jgi:hypothetical protein
MKTAKNPEEVEYFVGLDNTDPKRDVYMSVFGKDLEHQKNLCVYAGDSTNGIQAINRIALLMRTDSEFIISVSDDMEPVQDWDVLVADAFKGVDNFKTPKVLYINDGLNSRFLMVYYVANKAFYHRLGYVFCEEYTSMFADNDLTEIAKRLDAIIPVSNFTFQHNHYTLGKTPFDETYARRNNETEFKVNEAVFNRRSREGFGL